MRTKILFFIFLIISLLCNEKYSFSQYLENKPSPKQRIFWGGDLSMSFGSYTVIYVNPMLGYRITNRLSSGIGFNYTYFNDRIYSGFEGSLYGYNIFSSYTLIKDLSEIIPIFSSGTGLLVYAEYNSMNIKEMLNVWEDANYWLVSPMLGLGFQYPAGVRSYMLVTILYNFNETKYSLYSNPIIRISFQF